MSLRSFRPSNVRSKTQPYLLQYMGRGGLIKEKLAQV